MLFSWRGKNRPGGGSEQVPLQNYLDQRFTDLSALIHLARETEEQRFTDLDKRLAGIGSRIDALDERLQVFERGKLTVAAHDALEARVQRIEQAVSNIQGRLWAITVGLTVITFVIDVALRYIH